MEKITLDEAQTFLETEEAERAKVDAAKRAEQEKDERQKRMRALVRLQRAGNWAVNNTDLPTKACLDRVYGAIAVLRGDSRSANEPDTSSDELDAANRRIEKLEGKLSDARERAGGLEAERDDLDGQLRAAEKILNELKKLVGLPDESTESELTNKIKSLVEDDKPEPPPAKREVQDGTTGTIINKEDTTAPESGHESAKPTQGRRTVDVPPPGQSSAPEPSEREQALEAFAAKYRGDGSAPSRPASGPSRSTGSKGRKPPARPGQPGEETD